jgi:hypothetical protein
MTDSASFKDRAARHQEWFRQHFLGIHRHGDKPTLLIGKDAAAGANFYEGFPIFEGVKERYPRSASNPLCTNMLRSEHVPFNFFAPLKSDLGKPYVVGVIRRLIGVPSVDSVKRMEVEYAPPKAAEHLGDNTSFDVYVEAACIDGSRIGVGVEVKYTETSYRYGDTEKKKMLDPRKESVYHRISRRSQLYKEASLDCLPTKKFKQVWRNHLLGAAMLEKRMVNRFHSVLLYPKENDYQLGVVAGYSALLADEKVDTFRGVSYQDFFSFLEDCCPKQEPYTNWIQYLRTRYTLK